MSRRKVISDEKVAHIRKLWSEQVTVRQLAEEAGCSVALIERILYDPTYRNGTAESAGISDAEFEQLTRFGST